MKLVLLPSEGMIEDVLLNMVQCDRLTQAVSLMRTSGDAIRSCGCVIVPLPDRSLVMFCRMVWHESLQRLSRDSLWYRCVLQLKEMRHNHDVRIGVKVLGINPEVLIGNEDAVD
jgi:hypothetical protein